MTTKPQKNYRAPPKGQLPREYKTETDKRNYHYPKSDKHHIDTSR